MNYLHPPRPEDYEWRGLDYIDMDSPIPSEALKAFGVVTDSLRRYIAVAALVPKTSGWGKTKRHPSGKPEWLTHPQPWGWVWTIHSPPAWVGESDPAKSE